MSVPPLKILTDHAVIQAVELVIRMIRMYEEGQVLTAFLITYTIRRLVSGWVSVVWEEPGPYVGILKGSDRHHTAQTPGELTSRKASTLVGRDPGTSHLLAPGGLDPQDPHRTTLGGWEAALVVRVEVNPGPTQALLRYVEVAPVPSSTDVGTGAHGSRPYELSEALLFLLKGVHCSLLYL
jgi:hypothetical protein